MISERIILAGALLLIPNSLQFFRLLAALLTSALATVFTLLAMPYKKVMYVTRL